jgi:hypothetical protein
MKKTTFAGITVLDPGEDLGIDNSAFTGRDREIIDRLLQVGAKLHRHNATMGLSVPTQPPSASIIASGGTIAPELTLSVGYTLEDSQGGETTISPVSVVTTGSPLSTPAAAPSAAIDYSDGSLLADTYYYGLTWVDGDGGETPLGGVAEVERAPGFASGQVNLTNLNFGMGVAGAVGWHLYRAIGGGTFDYLASGGVVDSVFTDDGSHTLLCDVHPPLDADNSTRQVNTLQVTLPTADPNISAATLINLYVTTTGDFGQASLLASYPVASAGSSPTYADLDLQDRMPPDVNLSIGGANQIDPDTEILDWHWKRPVGASGELGSGSLGDVRLVKSTGDLYGVLSPLASAASPAQWTRLASAGGGGGGSPLTASASNLSVANVTNLAFIGASGLGVSLSEVGAGKAVVRLIAPSAAPTGVTASAASGVSVASALNVTFVGSAGLGVKVSPGDLGQAVVTLGAPIASAVPLLASAASGSPGLVPDTHKVHLVGSGGLNVALSQPTTGEAKYILSAPTNDIYSKLAASGMGVVYHSASASATRPDGFSRVFWIGTVKPVNSLDTDPWLNPNDAGIGYTDWGIVTSLPTASAAKGDRCMYQADKTNGIYWSLLYDGEGTYPWKKIGGPPLRDKVIAVGTRNAATYGDCTGGETKVPTVTAPLKGEYGVEHGCQGQLTGGASSNGYASVSIAGSTPIDDDSGKCVAIDQFEGGTIHSGYFVKTLAATNTVAQKYKGHTNTFLWGYDNRWVTIDPVRVG